MRLLRPEMSPLSLRHGTEEHGALCSCMLASDYSKAPARRINETKINIM